jgi:hypothetical protein
MRLHAAPCCPPPPSPPRSLVPPGRQAATQPSKQPHTHAAAHATHLLVQVGGRQVAVDHLGLETRLLHAAAVLDERHGLLVGAGACACARVRARVRNMREKRRQRKRPRGGGERGRQGVVGAPKKRMPRHQRTAAAAAHRRAAHCESVASSANAPQRPPRAAQTHRHRVRLLHGCQLHADESFRLSRPTLSWGVGCEQKRRGSGGRAARRTTVMRAQQSAVTWHPHIRQRRSRTRCQDAPKLTGRLLGLLRGRHVRSQNCFSLKASRWKKGGRACDRGECWG